jgi:hypothetical protein
MSNSACHPPDISPVLATALAQTVPQLLADYTKFSLTGDLLTEDGQLDKAQVMYGRAELSLVKETEKFTFQQRQVRRWTRMSALTNFPNQNPQL